MLIGEVVDHYWALLNRGPFAEGLESNDQPHTSLHGLQHPHYAELRNAQSTPGKQAPKDACVQILLSARSTEERKK